MSDPLEAPRRWGATALATLDRWRPRFAPLDVAWRTVELDRARNGSILSAAVALRLFVFVVPLGLVLVTGVGLLADAGQEAPAALARRAGITGLIASAVGSAGDLTAVHRIVLLVGGLYTCGRAARTLRRTLEVSHGVVWDEPPAPPTGVRPVASLLGCAALAAVLLLALGRLRAEHALAGGVATLTAVALPLLGWLALSDRLPHRGTSRRDLLPGAVLMAVGVQVVHVATVYVLARQVSGRSETYGALAVAMSVLLWATLLGRFVVAAAELDVAVWQHRRGSPDRGDGRPPAGGDGGATADERTSHEHADHLEVHQR